MKKIFFLLILSLSIINTYGQSWTTCGTTAGTLSGSSTEITINQSTSEPIYVTSPSPIATIPQNEFLIVLHDSLADDNLGDLIIMSSSTAIFTPSSLGLSVADTISIVSFSYDIQQIKQLTDGLLKNSVPFLGSCCGIVDNQSAISGFCTSLNAAGISSNNDVNTLQDVMSIVSIYNYGVDKPLSLEGFKNGLDRINTDITTYNGIGCTNSVAEICYAFDALTTNHDKYVVIPTCSNTNGINTETACTSFDWIDGQTYTSSNNTATHTLTNAAGCDSVVTLDLTITDKTVGTDVQTACTSFDWIDGQTYTSSNNTATHTLTNAAGCDSVVTLDLTITDKTVGTDVQTACTSFDWIDGNTYNSSNNTATHTLTNAAGCDSIVTLDLTINAIDVETTLSESTISANNTSATTYQWINCADNSMMSGETNSSFIPTKSGNYAVIITEGSCSKTSACVSFVTLGLNELSLKKVNIYPNPVQNELFVEVKNEQITKIDIIDFSGKVIKSIANSTTKSIDVSELKQGIYVLKVSTETGVSTNRFIKK